MFRNIKQELDPGENQWLGELEIEDVVYSILHAKYKNGKQCLIAYTHTNCMSIGHHYHIFDDTFSLDENLYTFWETIKECEED